MWTVVLEDFKAGKVGSHGKCKESGVCSPEEGGFGSDPTVSFQPVTGLGIKDACFLNASFSSEDKRENRLKMQGGLYSAERVTLGQFGIGHGYSSGRTVRIRSCRRKDSPRNHTVLRPPLVLPYANWIGRSCL